MAKGLITHAYLEDTADAIRVLRGENDTYTPDEFGEKILDAIPDVEVTGSIVGVTDAAAYPAEKLEFAIEPVQEGSGDPSPENIRPISGWTGVNGERTGKNLFDKATVTLDKYMKPDGTEINAAGNGHSAFIAVTPNIPYYFTNISGSTSFYSMITYDANKTPIGAVNITGIGAVSGTKTFDSNVSYIIVNFDSTYLNTIQIELGSTATDYEPYQGTSIPITFPTEAGTVYGGKVDVVKGKLTVDRVITDISTSISSYSENSVTVRGFITIPPMKTSDGLVDNIMCDKLKTYVPDYIYRNDIMGVSENNHPTVKGIWIGINKTLLSEISKTGMIQWIQDNNPKLVYELATPVEYDITPQQIQMLLGDNNLWCDTGDTTLKYKVDLGRFIAKLQAAQATPQLSLSRQAVSLDAPMDAEPITQKADVLERKSAETDKQKEQEEQEEQDEQQQGGEGD